MLISSKEVLAYGVDVNYGQGRLLNGRGGQAKFTPTKRGGGEKGFRHSDGVGGTTSFGIVLTWVLEVLFILEVDTKGFQPIKKKRGGVKRLKRGRKFRSCNAPILYPSLPVTNAQSVSAWIFF